MNVKYYKSSWLQLIWYFYEYFNKYRKWKGGKIIDVKKIKTILYIYKITSPIHFNSYGTSINISISTIDERVQKTKY
jgi:hypothetical protein